MSKINIEEKIANAKAFMLYIGGEHCSVCKALYPKISQRFGEEFPQIEQLRIEIEEEKEFVSSLQIFIIPTVIIYFEGKEFFRESRNISVDLLAQKVSRPYELFID